MGRRTNITMGGGRVGHVFRAFRKDLRGVAAMEFALIAGILCFLVINVFDFAAYAYISMQVKTAAEMGAQAAWQTCDPSKQPATTQCGSALTTAVQAAIAAYFPGERHFARG